MDRFSPESGVNAVRAEGNSLPGPGEPIDFDQPPFLVTGLGPRGERIRYYDFDAKGETPGKLYVFLREREPIEGQLPVLSHVPGEPGYNDLVRVYEVLPPPGYRANSITGEADLLASKYLIAATERILNRVVVPPGSTAALRLPAKDNALARAWHQGRVAHFLSFEDDVPSQSIGYDHLAVSIATIWLTFNINPGEPGGGPASGRKTEAGTDRAHTVSAALPGDVGYSPLWMAIVYDNLAFDRVVDLASAERAPVVPGIPSPFVNSPVVSVEEP